MSASVETIKNVEAATGGEYKYGFYTDIDSEFAPKGLSEDIVKFISAKKEEYENLRDITKGQYRREVSRINEKEYIIWTQERYLKELRENEVVEDEKGMGEEETSGLICPSPK